MQYNSHSGSHIEENTSLCFFFLPLIDPDQNRTNNYGTFCGTIPNSFVVSVLWHNAKQYLIAHLTLPQTLYNPFNFLSPKWKRSSLQNKPDKYYLSFGLCTLCTKKTKTFECRRCIRCQQPAMIAIGYNLLAPNLSWQKLSHSSEVEPFRANCMAAKIELNALYTIFLNGALFSGFIVLFTNR